MTPVFSFRATKTLWLGWCIGYGLSHVSKKRVRRAPSVVSLGGSSMRVKDCVFVEWMVARRGVRRVNWVMRSTDRKKDRSPTCASSGSSGGGSTSSVRVVSLRSCRSWSCVVVANTAESSWVEKGRGVRVCESNRCWCTTSRATRVCLEEDVSGYSIGWDCMWSSRL